MKVLCIVFALVVAQVAAQNAYYASCELKGTEADPTIRGTVFFHQETYDGAVTVTVSVAGVTTNIGQTHGMHIHTFGDLSDQTSAAVGVGAHWNYNASLVHGCPEIDGLNRHNGDLGNFNVTDAGVIDQVKIIPDLINLSGPDSIIGRGLVLHAITDPCTNGTVYGARIALCVIGVQNTTQLVNVTNSAVNSNQYTQAVCFLQPTIYSNVSGSVWFTQSASGTTVVGYFNQLTGIHGFHVHQFGDLRGNDGLASGSHWNPDNVAHGIPPFTPRHGGDLGNIYSYANDSKAWYYYVNNDILTLSGPKSIVGRTLTVHVDPDNCTPPTGGAGSRISQCVVGLVNTTYNPPPTVPAEIQSTQNISACQTLYPVNATSTPATQTSASTDVQTTTTAASNAIALVPLAFLLLAILVFSL